MISLLPVEGMPLIVPGDDLATRLLAAIETMGEHVLRGDVLVVAQKIVSKAEGRIVRLDDVTPSAQAFELAESTGKDARLVELILRESDEVVRSRPGLIIVQDRRGFICANAGIDRSNIEQSDGETVALLPVDPDASATRLRNRLREETGLDIGLVINDSHGRAWREGTVGVAIGAAGVPIISDRRGDVDLTGYTLQHTIIGLVDEMAAAASLLMGPAAEGVPAVIIRGLELAGGDGSARDLQRPRDMDLFR